MFLTFSEYKSRPALVKNRISEVNLPARGKMQLVGQHDEQRQSLFFKALRPELLTAARSESEFLNIISNNWMRVRSEGSLLAKDFAEKRSILLV